jgi:hypothetical protein
MTPVSSLDCPGCIEPFDNNYLDQYCMIDFTSIQYVGYLYLIIIAIRYGNVSLDLLFNGCESDELAIHQSCSRSPNCGREH